jgi:hypothetical protein
VTEHPMQPIERAKDGVIRFKANAIVRWLVDSEQIDLNQISIYCQEHRVPKTDVEQFWQLLGYSVSGYRYLDFVRKATIATADEIASQSDATVKHD